MRTTKAFLFSLCVGLWGVCSGHEVVTPFDKIPDFAETPSVVTVKNGLWSDASVWSTGAVPKPTDVVLLKHQVTYSGNGDVNVLGIAGAAALVWTGQAGKLSACTIQVFPGGTLNVQPVGPSELVIKDCPIDTVKDPEQYGTGILAVDATVTLRGTFKDTWAQLGAEALAGQTTLTLAKPVAGWLPGDTLVLPDTRQLLPSQMTKVLAGGIPPTLLLVRTNPGAARFNPQWELPTLKSGTTLNAPLQFSHRGAYDPDGNLDFLPHVGNLTRSLVIRSANPSGTRGHMLVTMKSALSVQFVQFQDFGRTTAGAIDSTVIASNGAVTKLGTNQVGRYPIHIHHIRGPVNANGNEFVIDGNAIINAKKWGIAIHDSSYGLVRGNVIYNADGAGIATEDGSEIGNVFEKNFVVRCDGSGFGVESRGRGIPQLGHEGSCFWFRGARNVVRDNVAANARFAGFMYFALLAPKAAKAAAFPGADPTKNWITLDVPFTIPIEFARNTAYGGNMSGLEVWQGGVLNIRRDAPADVGGHPVFGVVKDLTLWHNSLSAFTGVYVSAIHFDGLKVRGDVAALSDPKAMPSATAGHFHVSWRFMNSDIQGLRVGPVGRVANQLLDTSFLRNELNVRALLEDRLNAGGQIILEQENIRIRNVQFEPLPGKPARHIEAGGAPLAASLTKATTPGTPAKIVVERFQGVATDNFDLYFLEQVPEFVIPGKLGVPAANMLQAGITNGENLATYGRSLFGAMAPCKTTRDGMRGYVCKNN